MLHPLSPCQGPGYSVFFYLPHIIHFFHTTRSFPSVEHDILIPSAQMCLSIFTLHPDLCPKRLTTKDYINQTPLPFFAFWLDSAIGNTDRRGKRGKLGYLFPQRPPCKVTTGWLCPSSPVRQPSPPDSSSPDSLYCTTPEGLPCSANTFVNSPLQLTS